MKLVKARVLPGALALAAASLLVLGGCAKNEEKGPMERAGAAADKAVEKAKEAAKSASFKRDLRLRRVQGPPGHSLLLSA